MNHLKVKHAKEYSESQKLQSASSGLLKSKNSSFKIDKIR